MKTVLVGDIGGHLDVFQKVLRQIGVSENLVLPKDVEVIQVGDLVRANPNFVHSNTEIVRLVRSIILSNPGRWTQLYGNHECAALGGPTKPSWDLSQSFEPECTKLLTDLWRSGAATLATTVRSEDSEFLVTHSGLTCARWKKMGRPDARLAANIINNSVGRDFATFSVPGRLISGRTNLQADTLWAEVNYELLLPWIESREVPFSQIHGHASPFHWPDDNWWSDTPHEVRSRTAINRDVRRSQTRLDAAGKICMSIDWTLESDPPHRIWKLLELSNE